MKHIYTAKDYRTMDLEEVLTRHREAQNGGRLLKDRPYVRVSRVKAPEVHLDGQEASGMDGCAEYLVVKENIYRGRDILKNLVTENRGMRAWRAAHRFRLIGLSTPEPLALVEEKRLGVVVRSYLITRYLEGALDLNLYTYKNFEATTGDCPQRKGRFLESLGQAIKAMHRASVYHADLSGKNILVRAEAEDLRFYFLDLESVSLPKFVSDRRRVKSLAQVNDSLHHFTCDERMRLVEVYLGEKAIYLGKTYFEEMRHRTEKRRKRRERLGYRQFVLPS